MRELYTQFDVDPDKEDRPQDNCAIVGAFSREMDVAQLLYNGLVELNHRGQEGSGISITDGSSFSLKTGLGLAGVVFSERHGQGLPQLPHAHIGIGHNRYSTSGSDLDTQPFIEEGISLGHNGNLTNIAALRQEFGLPDEIDGVQSDSRAALAIISKMPGANKDKILAGIKKFEGAHSLVISTQDALYASRDPLGFRPLSLGQIKGGKGFVVASENAAFASMKASYIRDLQAGETIMITDEGVRTIGLDQRSQLAQCIFELIYISRPDSTVFGTNIYQFRSKQGEILARHMPDIDIAMPVPRSGIAAAQGVANSEEVRSRGILYQDAIYTNPYRGVDKGHRTFIRPNERDKAATEKYSVNRALVEGKRVAIIEDSIVRGSLKYVVTMLRDAGATEVHALVASPPLKHACFMGVDFGTGELLAHRFPDIHQRAAALNLDSLYHLSYAETIEAALGNPVDEEVGEEIFEKNNFCGACFTGRYPVSVDGVIPRSSDTR